MQDTKKVGNPFAMLPPEDMNRITQPLDSPHHLAHARRPRRGTGWAESAPRAQDKEAGTYRSDDDQVPFSSLLPRERDEIGRKRD